MGTLSIVRLTELWRQFRSVECFWTHLHIADNVASYHGLSRHQPCSHGFFANAD